MYKITSKLSLVVFAGLFLAQSELAAGGVISTNIETNSIYPTTMMDWVGGSLGKVLAVACVVVGVVGGIARKSIMAIGTAIAGGVALGFTSAIVDNTITATTEKLIMNPESFQSLTVKTSNWIPSYKS